MLGVSRRRSGRRDGLAQPPRSAELSEVLIAAPRGPGGLSPTPTALLQPRSGGGSALLAAGTEGCVCVCICVCRGGCACKLEAPALRSLLPRADFLIFFFFTSSPFPLPRY